MLIEAVEKWFHLQLTFMDEWSCKYPKTSKDLEVFTVALA